VAMSSIQKSLTTWLSRNLPRERNSRRMNDRINI
jgi:hypothetical protein